MKKSEEIKILKHELGRAQKKVGDQYKELSELRKMVKAYDVGTEQTHHAVNLVMSQVCATFGEEVLDDDGKHIGIRVTMPKPTEETLQKYAMRTELSDDGVFTIGLVLKEDQE